MHVCIVHGHRQQSGESWGARGLGKGGQREEWGHCDSVNNKKIISQRIVKDISLVEFKRSLRSSLRC